jgi:hypothetical protein
MINEYDSERRKPKDSKEKTYPNDTPSTTNPTLTALGTNHGLHGEKPVTSCLWHDPVNLLTHVQ